MIDGWICPACWKRNSARSGKCYKCKLPRGADREVVAAQRVAVQEFEAAPQPEDAVPDLVVAIPAVVFMYHRWLARLEALLILVVSVLLMPFIPLLVAAGPVIAAVCWAVGAMSGAIATGMRERRMWAFLVGVAISGVQGIGFFVAIALVWHEAPEALGAVPAEQLWLSAGMASIHAIAAACALIGLVYLLVTPRPSIRPVPSART